MNLFTVLMAAALAGSVEGKLIAAIAEKADKNSLAINGIDYGVTGDGTTDDSTAIQTLLDRVSLESSERNSTGNGTLYLPNRTYLISTPLLINSNVHFRCEGRIVYNGTGSAVILDGRYCFVDIAMISAPNGTGFEMTASRHSHETMDNNVRIGRIRPCARGMYFHDHDGEHAVTTSYIQCDHIDSGTNGSGTYGIEIWGDNKWLTELHFQIGFVTNFQNGVYIHDAGAIRFHRLHVEGVTLRGVILKDADNCTFENTRMEENYGNYMLTFRGEVKFCLFEIRNCIFDKIDISELTSAANNVMRARSYNSGGSTHHGFSYILTNCPSTGAPAWIPSGRTAAVRYDLDSYNTVENLYKLGFAVFVVHSGGGPSALSLERVDTTNKIALFTALYPTAGADGGYVMTWTCSEVNGQTVWAKATNEQLQTKAKMVTEITASSSDSQYPSAKAVWMLCSDMATKTWVREQNYLTLQTLPVYNGGVS